MAQPPTGEVRKRAARGASGPRTVYVVLQILDDAGHPVLFDKKKVKLVALETSADTMLSMVEGEEHEHSFFIRGKIARRGRTTSAPAPTGLQQGPVRAA